MRCFLLLDHTLNVRDVHCRLIVFQILWSNLLHQVWLLPLFISVCCDNIFCVLVLLKLFCSFLNRLVYLHTCLVLSSSLIIFYFASMKVSIVRWFLFGAHFLLLGFSKITSSVCSVTLVLPLKNVLSFSFMCR